MPEVSIIVNCFNEERFLSETLDSAFAQTFTDWEIVFWDNASTDASGTIAKSYGEKVRYFRSDVNIPLGRARKLAYDETRGNYVAILDADDLWLPEKLERQLALFQANAELGLVYCDSMYFDANGDLYSLFQLNRPHKGEVFGHLLSKNFMFTSSMMFNKEFVKKLGYGFDDRLVRAQDYELSLRMAYHFPVDYVEDALCKWRNYKPTDKPYKSSLVSRVSEIKWAVDNLVDMYPDINDRFSADLKIAYRRLDYEFGVTAWEQGEVSQARSYLSRHLTSKRFAFVYLCTLVFSHKFFYRMRTEFRKLITRPGPLPTRSNGQTTPYTPSNME